MYTTDDINLRNVAMNIANSEKFNNELIPEIPLIMYYDDKGNKLYTDNRQEFFYAFDLWVCANHLLGYYCEVSTEWWDDNNEYQGPTGKRNYKKFYFNDNNTGQMSDFPYDIFRFNLECAIAKRKTFVPENKD